MEKQLDWKNPDDYAYLQAYIGNKAKKVNPNKKAIAWEYLRRSPEYRADYASFHALQEKHGKDWRKQQKAEIYSPPKLSGESDKAWMRRIADKGLRAEKITQSQALARKWWLFDMYDPSIQYSESRVRFTPVKKNLAFFADPSVHPLCNQEILNERKLKSEDLKTLQGLDFLENLQESPIEHALFIVVDVRLPMKEQFKKAEKVFQAIAKYSEEKANSPKVQKQDFITRIRFLDGYLSNPKPTNVEIYKTVTGIRAMEVDKAARAANGFKNLTLKHANEGYKKLLFDV